MLHAMSLMLTVAYWLSGPGVGSAAVQPPQAAADTSYRCFSASERNAQKRFEAELNKVPTPSSLSTYHALIGETPHVAGTENDHRAAEKLADALRSLGLEVEMQELWVYLAEPIAAELEIITPAPAAPEHRDGNAGDDGAATRDGLARRDGIGPREAPAPSPGTAPRDRFTRRSLRIKEEVLPEDPYSANPDVGFGWNAYSGNGDVTAPVVYANYGTRADFDKLKELGVSVAGKIVIARYGGNYRGYKAKFAEADGAVGLIIYTDPADSGFTKGLMYPEGGYANPTSIQRGSIKTLAYDGDPLTPFYAATRDAKRLDPDEVALPRIPVQPIGWGAAQQILVRMRGRPVPKGWQGGLPFTYRVTDGDDLKVRLMVRQKRGLKKVTNVVGTLRGAVHPEQRVIVGCHYDAWTFGAGDPLAGTMVLLESARSFASLARAGFRPARSVVFANWAAEEHGIIGSVEWVEAHRDELMRTAVAYLNLDMAAMGRNFGSSAAPGLQTLIADATRAVRWPTAPDDESSGTKVAASADRHPANDTAAALPRTVFDAWLEKSEDDRRPGYPRFGDLGGGSDHVGFYCHLAIPSAGLGAGGAEGVSYHSAYDNLAWYRKVIPGGYEPAKMVTQVTNVVLARLANATVLPLDPVRYGPDVRRHLASLADRARELNVNVDFTKIENISKDYETKAARVYGEVLNRLERDALPADRCVCVNKILHRVGRQWYYEAGLPGGMEWYRNLYAATDPDSGYAAWMLPGYRWSIEQKRPPAIFTARKAYYRVFTRLLNLMDELEACVRTADSE